MQRQLSVQCTVFSRNGVPHVLVGDNAAKFGDAGLMSWLQRIGCRSLKTPQGIPNQMELLNVWFNRSKRHLWLGIRRVKPMTLFFSDFSLITDAFLTLGGPRARPR